MPIPEANTIVLSAIVAFYTEELVDPNQRTTIENIVRAMKQLEAPVKQATDMYAILRGAAHNPGNAKSQSALLVFENTWIIGENPMTQSPFKEMIPLVTKIVKEYDAKLAAESKNKK